MHESLISFARATRLKLLTVGLLGEALRQIAWKCETDRATKFSGLKFQIGMIWMWHRIQSIFYVTNYFRSQFAWSSDCNEFDAFEFNRAATAIKGIEKFANAATVQHIRWLSHLCACHSEWDKSKCCNCHSPTFIKVKRNFVMPSFALKTFANSMCHGMRSTFSHLFVGFADAPWV